MPSMANITVKNAAGTDVIYVAAMPSAGDSSPARWTQNALVGVAGFRPKLDIVTRSNNAETRRADFTFTYPVTYTDSSTGLVAQRAVLKFTGTYFAPNNLTTDQWNEGFVQLGNLLVSSLVRSSIQDGYAPT